MSQQHIENSELLLRSLEPNTNNNNTSRLPLRKRVGPILKWQPVETPQEHLKPKPYPLQQAYHTTTTTTTTTTTPPSEETHSETEDPLKSKPLKKHWMTKQDEKRSFSEDNILNRPVKKVKRGRPPLSKQNSVDLKNEIPTPPINNTRPTTATVDSTLIDTNVLYCICKRPYDVPRFMIACDKCDQWFHGECIQISEKQGEFIDLYFCENCAKITGKKTIWKPKCANPNCEKAARIGTHQGHLSKYCTDNCGMQVARARIELAEIKKRNSCNEEDNTTLLLSRSKLSSFADLDDRSRLSRVKDEKLHAKFIISIGEFKSKLLSLLIQYQKDDICGFDSRLSWPDIIWEKVTTVEKQEDNNHLLKNDKNEIVNNSKSYTICQQNRKCNKHLNWQKLKTFELEQERSEQFVILTMLERERQQIKARMKKRREEIDLADYLENGTISHF